MGWNAAFWEDASVYLMEGTMLEYGVLFKEIKGNASSQQNINDENDQYQVNADVLDIGGGQYLGWNNCTNQPTNWHKCTNRHKCTNSCTNRHSCANKSTNNCTRWLEHGTHNM